MKHLIVIRMSAMGDVAMTVPVIRNLIEQNPNIQVTIVSRPFFKPFFDNIDRVNFYSVDLNKRHKGFKGLLNLFKDLKSLNVDYVADLHNVLRSQVIRTLFNLSGKKVAALDKGRSDKRSLTRETNKVFKPLKSMHQRYADVFNILGFKTDLSINNFPKKSEINSTIQPFLTKNKKIIGIAPFAQYTSKVYPLDLMQEVINQLSNNKENKIILFGGKNELEDLNKLQNNLNNVEVIAGKISFTDELNLIQHLDLMISMDSGNAHIASMYGIKTLVLFGATHPYAGFMPFGQPIENALIPDLNKYPKLPTSVYGNKIVEGYQDVMRSITPEMVVKKVNESL